MRTLRVGVFADICNLYYSGKEKFSGRKVNYEKLLKHCLGAHNIIVAHAYGIETGNEEVFKQRLTAAGWTPKFKKAKQFHDGHMKGDQDINLAMDIVRHLDMLDSVIVCSGDGDFAPVLQWCNERGRLTVVRGFNVSYELKNVARDWAEIGLDMMEGSRGTS